MSSSPLTPDRKERPILFSGPMVRAILDGKKTQTRRVVRDMPRGYEFVEEQERGFLFEYVGIRHLEIGFDTDERSDWVRCPYGKPGDRLWVRETWAELIAVSPSTDQPIPIGPGGRLIEPPTQWTDGQGRTRWRYDGTVIAYRANSEIEFCDGDGFSGGMANRDDMPRWRPSIFMPQKFSRLTLEVVSVRAERLCSISEKDAQAEGVAPFFEAYAGFGQEQTISTGERAADSPHRASFACLWDEINGDRAPWKSNPWVWAIEFRRLP